MEIKDISVEDIEILDWETIEKKFKTTEDEVYEVLKKGKHHADNFWTPYEEDSYSEEEVEKVKELFITKFPSVQINSQNDPKFLEIYLELIDMHILMYSIKACFKKIKKSQKSN